MTDLLSNIGLRRHLSRTHWLGSGGAVAICFGLIFGAWSLGAVERAQVEDRYVASDGVISYRLDLNDKEDRSLLASLILNKEGRVYGFEKRSKSLGGSSSRTNQDGPQVFDLGNRQDADRLSAAISGGRSTFFVARKGSGDDLGIAERADRGAASAQVQPAGDQPDQARRTGRPPALTVDRINRYVARDGSIGRRIDLQKADDRSRLTAMIAKREGRVYGFEKGRAIFDNPEVFDFFDSKSADRLASVISGNRHVLFVANGEPPLEGAAIASEQASQTNTAERATTGTAKLEPAALAKPELKPANFRRSSPSSPDKDTPATDMATRMAHSDTAAGGPIQLMPRDRSSSEDFPIFAARDDAQSDSDLPILEFLDDPLIDNGEAAGTDEVGDLSPLSAGKQDEGKENDERVVAYI